MELDYISDIIFKKCNKKTLNFNFRKTEDGRLDSANDEAETLILVKNFIEKETPFKVELCKARFYCDFFICNEQIKLPVNLKISQMNSSPDNVSSLTGLIYAISSIVPKNNNKELGIKLIHGINELKADYGFLIVNKITKTMYFTTYKYMPTRILVPNGNNLPFQAKWKELETLEKLDNSDVCQAKLLKKLYHESLNKRTPKNKDLLLE